jgi:hypothetical protein
VSRELLPSKVQELAVQVPLKAAMGGAFCVVLVRVAVPLRLPTATASVQVPAADVAVRVGAVATPVASVVTDAVAPDGKVPDGPVAGAVNDTPTPATGLAPASVTVATTAVGKAVPAVVV